MTDQDVKELVELEIAVIAFIKIILQKKEFGAIVAECLSNTQFHSKVKLALDKVQDIPAELKQMTMGKWMDIVKAAVSEVA